MNVIHLSIIIKIKGEKHHEQWTRDQMAWSWRTGCQDRSITSCRRSYVQGFPEYGPERMGAPITAYNRISDEVIRVHSNIYTPGLVVVVDETLLHSVDVTAGLKEDGAIIVNTPKSADEIKPMLNGYQGKVYTVDARKISVQALGKYFPNSPMLAAAVAVSGVMKKDAFISEMRASYQHKFAKKPEVIDGNMQALELTYEELKDVL